MRRGQAQFGVVACSLALSAACVPAALASANAASKCGVQLKPIRPVAVGVKPGTSTNQRTIYLPVFAGTVFRGKHCAAKVSAAVIVKEQGLKPQTWPMATAGGKPGTNAKKRFHQTSFIATGPGVSFAFRVCSVAGAQRRCKVTRLPSKKAFLPAPRL